MTRTRSLAATLLLAVAALLLLPGTASATTTSDVVQSLRSNPVYVDPQATADVDAGTVRSAIGRTGRKIYVAVLPQKAADASGGAAALTGVLGRGLGDAGAIVFTVTGSTLTGQSGGQSGLRSGQAQQIADSNGSGDLTRSLVGAVQAADAAAGQQGTSTGTDPSGGFSGQSGGSSGGGGAAVVGVLALLGIGGGGLLYARSRKRRLGDLQGSRADVESLYGRLGADVSNLSGGDDPVVRQALADAAERYNATGALLSKADTPGEYAAARRTVVEGLTAARLARTGLGLDPGPEIPPPPGSGPQLEAARQVQVGDQAYDGSPTYLPGRQHYFGGGYIGGAMVPGGWYGVPFWETALLGSALSGGLGGGYGGFGGGYGGGGYARGYEEGVDDARDARDDGGSYGQGNGGGDWGGGGGGGGDWGGGGGGGDFGGGGGDSGGGSW